LRSFEPRMGAVSQPLVEHIASLNVGNHGAPWPTSLGQSTAGSRPRPLVKAVCSASFGGSLVCLPQHCLSLVVRIVLSSEIAERKVFMCRRRPSVPQSEDSGQL